MKKYVLLGFGLLAFFGCGSAGPAGPAGPQGSAGANGSQGQAGIDEGGFSSLFGCYKLSSGLAFAFEGITLTSGDVMVTCSVAGLSSELSNTTFYKSSDVGAQTFHCQVVSDADSTPSAGFWVFSFTSGTYQAIYNDSGSSVNNTTITYANSDCTFQ